MPPEDDARLRHLIEAAEKAVAYAAERDRKALDEDELLRLGLTKLVEIVGEAASTSAILLRRSIQTYRGPKPRACGIV
jgi:uncharacterized protein with HEPN domain